MASGTCPENQADSDSSAELRRARSADRFTNYKLAGDKQVRLRFGLGYGNSWTENLNALAPP